MWSIALQGRLSALAREAPALTTTDQNQTTTDETPEEFEPLAGRAPVSEDSPLFADLGVSSRSSGRSPTSASPAPSRSRR